MNPYASHLQSQDPLQAIAAAPGKIERAFQALEKGRSDEPRAEGKWSPREILVHLADTEIAFSFRLRQALAEDNHVIQPFDQDRWQAVSPQYDAAAALAVFTNLRRWNVALVESLAPDQLSRAVTHPERGTMTFQTIVETMAGHDLNHIKQLEAVAATHAH